MAEAYNSTIIVDPSDFASKRQFLLYATISVPLMGIFLNVPIILVTIGKELKEEYKWFIGNVALADILFAACFVIWQPVFVLDQSLLQSWQCYAFLLAHTSFGWVMAVSTMLAAFHRNAVITLPPQSSIRNFITNKRNVLALCSISYLFGVTMYSTAIFTKPLTSPLPQYCSGFIYLRDESQIGNTFAGV